MYILVWFPVLAVAVLLAVFLSRSLWHDLPFFFSYLTYALLSVVVRYSTFYLVPRWYFYVYWISDLGSSLVFLFPMYEVFLRRLFPNFQKTRFYRTLFPLAALIVLILTVSMALQADDRRLAFVTASRAFDFMRSAVLVFFIGLMLVMGRAWKRYDFGITLGFGVQACVALANSAVKMRLHFRPTVFDLLETIAYNISCVIWLITFFKTEAETDSEQLNPEILDQARTWESMLKLWLAPRRSKR